MTPNQHEWQVRLAALEQEQRTLRRLIVITVLGVLIIGLISAFAPGGPFGGARASRPSEFPDERDRI